MPNCERCNHTKPNTFICSFDGIQHYNNDVECSLFEHRHDRIDLNAAYHTQEQLDIQELKEAIQELRSQVLSINSKIGTNGQANMDNLSLPDYPYEGGC